MSTRIPQHASYDYPFLYIQAVTDGDGSQGVKVTMAPDDRGWVDAGYNRTEFIAAIETELDVIVIDRADLPEVKIVGGGPGGYDAQVGGQVHGILPDHTPDTYRSLAHRYLALAEHLENNPPVDEAAADALAALIIDANGSDSITQNLRIRAIARRLVQAGVTVKDPS